MWIYDDTVFIVADSFFINPNAINFAQDQSLGVFAYFMDGSNDSKPVVYK